MLLMELFKFKVYGNVSAREIIISIGCKKIYSVWGKRDFRYENSSYVYHN